MPKPYFDLPPLDPFRIAKEKNIILLETLLRDGENFRSYFFCRPVRKIVVKSPGGIKNAFRDIEKLSKKYFIAGYFSYELGYFMDYAGKIPDLKGQTLLDVGVFRDVTEFNHVTGRMKGPGRSFFVNKTPIRPFSISNLKFSYCLGEYVNKIKRIKEHISAGRTYQVNFTGRFDFDLKGDAYSFYRDLSGRQPVSYAAFMKLGMTHIISLSPELYLRRDLRGIVSRPMKGTAGRGGRSSEDVRVPFLMRKDPKLTAENLMIVDLMRNDLGRIAESGSVVAEPLFKVEKYKTLFQMTSTVKAVLKKDMGYYDIFRTTFPGGSVTGAPKIETMNIISRMEKGPRGVYCGAIGMIRPGGHAVLNMPIRTVVISGNKGIMGVGGGIIHDSDPVKEYNECLLKARFLTGTGTAFELLETILWRGYYWCFEEHLARMERSARHFGFKFARGCMISALDKARRKFASGRAYRVRLLLDDSGRARTEAFILGPSPAKAVAKAYISGIRTDPSDIFLRHKTTRRDIYDAEHKKAVERGFFDAIFMNKRGEVTEGAISNLVIAKKGKLYTPPVSCGLLPGIFRGHLVSKCLVKEKTLSEKDVLNADRVFLCNSVRGLTEVKLSRYPKI